MFDWNTDDKKVLGIVEWIKVYQGVYNGRQKIHAANWMFMTGGRIVECIKNLKIKNTEGFNRIPQRIIIDGLDSLIKPLLKMFELVYRTWRSRASGSFQRSSQFTKKVTKKVLKTINGN